METVLDPVVNFNHLISGIKLNLSDPRVKDAIELYAQTFEINEDILLKLVSNATYPIEK